MSTNMPQVTPAHQRLISEVVQFAIARTYELLQATGFPSPPMVTPDQLHNCFLAKELRLIARYAEGYDLGEGDIRGNIERIYRMLFPAPYPATDGYQLPPDFYKTSLGEMIHAALARHYPVSQRMKAGEAGRALSVSRQTIHTWADDGTLTPVYDQGQLTFVREEVQQLQRKRGTQQK